LVTLEAVTPTNRSVVESLTLSPEQRRFLSTPDLAAFLAEAHLHTSFQPFAIVADTEICGLVSFGRISDSPARWWISLLAVDLRHQRKGIGRAGMREVIETICAANPEGGSVGLSFHPENAAARQLYESIGMVVASTPNHDGELEAVLTW
jgi:diamine N-acetyltransferase